MGGGGGGGELSSTQNVDTAAPGVNFTGWNEPGAANTGAYGAAPEVAGLYNPNAGVQTGIPQGGFAAPGIAQYFAGGGDPTAGVSYNAGQHDAWLTDVGAGAAEGAQGFADTTAAAEIAAAEAAAAANEPVDISGGGGVLTDEFGGEITADNAFETGLAENIVDTINEGGINPETGDANIVAGPNVLSAADEGIFGLGSDYNEEFVENYNAQSDHSDNNPTGQTTGTPLYDQGYVGLGVDPLADAIGGAVNNSLIGTVGSAITGESLMADVDSLLPPAESFSDYGSDDNDNDNSWQNDGNPNNDQGNAGWGFTSIADMFDGGGPGQSGDSYTGGIHGDNTVGDTDEGVTSIVSDWWGGDDDDGGSDDGGGGGGGGGGCVFATHALANGVDLDRRGTVKWCESTLHDHYFGELIRKGYRIWGRQQIAKGNGAKHYREFQEAIAHARGVDRSFRTGIKLYARWAQFIFIALTQEERHDT